METTTLQTQREITTLLTRIQEACRAYPTQSEGERKMTFATIRTAAETVGAVTEDTFSASLAEEVRREVNQLTSALDELADRSGAVDAALCGACAKTLATAKLGGGRVMRYCTFCPTPILTAVREISDLTGVDVL